MSSSEQAREIHLERKTDFARETGKEGTSGKDGKKDEDAGAVSMESRLEKGSRGELEKRLS